MTKHDSSLNEFLDRIIVQVEQLIVELNKKDQEIERMNLEIIKKR